MSDERRKTERRKEWKPPAYHHYAKEWLVDTQRLSLEEQGAFQRLLDHQWINGALPTEERDRANLLSVTLVTFRRIWRRIGDFFPNGLNSRLEEVRAEQQAYREAQAASGQRGAAKRWHGGPNGKPNGEPMAIPSPENGKPIGDPNGEPHGESMALQSASASASELPKSKALVPLRGTRLSVPAIVQGLQDTALTTARRENAQTRRDVFVEIVFAYWAKRLGHERVFLDPKRRSTLRTRLVENGDDLSELLYVVDGALRDDWTMGRTPRSTKRYDGIETIYQDRAHVEKFAAECAAFKKGEPHPMAAKYGEAA